MVEEKENSFIVFCLVISCIIGAGVFTGQEILTYFGRASIVGFVSALICATTFFFLLRLCLCLNKNKLFLKLCQTKWFKITSCGVYVIVGGAMLAALSAIFGSIYIPLAVCLVGAVFAGVLEKLFDKVNILFCLLMLAIIFYITGKNAGGASVAIFSEINFPFLKSISFAAFNLFLCAPMLAKKGKGLSGKKVIAISLGASAVFFVLIIMSMLALTKAGNVLPFLYMTNSNKFYLVVLCICAMTTLFAVYVGVKRLVPSKLVYVTCVFASLLLSLISFDKIVSVFYVGASVFALYFFARLILFSK